MPLNEKLEPSDLLPSADEMADFDRHTISSVGIAGLDLMERAGTACAKRLKSLNSSQKVLILCGPGNNGGDGYVIARLLKEFGRSIFVVQAQADRYSLELTEKRKRFEESGGAVIESSDFDLKALRGDKEPILILDALLGTGQASAPRGPVALLLAGVKANLLPEDFIVAIDVPTALNPSTGIVYDEILPVNITLTFEYLKRGLTQAAALDACGQVEVLHIGIVASRNTEFIALNKNTAPEPPVRPSGAHKGTFGHVVIIGGSRRMPGAPVLSARAALLAGAGKVTVITPTENSIRLASLPEAMWILLDAPAQIFIKDHLKEITESLSSASALVIGPGVGRDPETLLLLKEVIVLGQQTNIPMVLDADALCMTVLSELSKGAALLTPHPGEAARLLTHSVQQVQEDRFLAVKKLREQFGCPTLLKGAGSLLSVANGNYINTSGTSDMATAGSGDVLSGLLGALLAQKMSPDDALLCGTYAHGLAGEIASQEHGGGILASDIASAIPSAMRVLRE